MDIARARGFRLARERNFRQGQNVNQLQPRPSSRHLLTNLHDQYLIYTRLESEQHNTFKCEAALVILLCRTTFQALAPAPSKLPFKRRQLLEV